MLGKLSWLPDFSHWFSQVRQPTGDRLDVIVEPGDDDRHAFIEPAARLFRWAMNHERRILRTAIREELLELYNSTWRQEDEQKLSAKDFADQLEWSLLTISASDIAPVEFSYEADDLFGGHGVTVDVDKELRFRSIQLRG